jgi:type II secretory pathway pseudopilin PulG
LVELLIVIGLLGAIALIVIAAINPIEQANRAKDARYKADGGQLISAIDRYFAAKNEFPWVTSGDAADNDVAFGFVSANNQGVGICATTGDCSTSTDTGNGNLISALELKTEFKRRDFIKATTNDKMLMVGKGGGALGASESVYACFIPAAKSTREKSCADNKVYTIGLSDGSRTAVGTACEGAEATAWTTNLWYICIPE